MLRCCFIFLFAILIFGCNPGPHPEDAVKMNDSIVFKQDTFYIHLDEFINLIKNEADTHAIHEKYQQITQYTSQTLTYFDEMQPFDEKDDLRKAAIAFFKNQQDLLLTEYNKLIALLSIAPENITISTENTWDSLMSEVMRKDSLAAAEFLIVQDSFAIRYDITLKDID